MAAVVRRARILFKGLFDVVKHGETIKLFVGDLDSEELESFCNKEQDDPDVG